MDVVVNIWNSFFSLAKQFRVSDALDVILVSFIIYSGIKLVRETRAEQLVKGILVLLAVWGLSYMLRLYMMKSLLTYFFQFSVMALLVVFQPEIRRALEQIGRSGIGNKHWTFGLPSDDYEVLAQQNRRGGCRRRFTEAKNRRADCF